MLIDQTTRQGPRQGKYDKLSFRTRLSRFFPNIPGAKEITIRNLLNHSSGLPDYVVLNEGGEDEFYAFYDGVMLASGDWYATMARKESHLRNEYVIDLLVKNGEPEFEPGTDYAYSNTGYVVLAEIIKKITGKPLSQFLREEVFDHLGMKKTFVFDHEPPEVKDHALCYVKSDDGQVRYRSISGDTIYSCIHGDGNVHSTISDLAKWLKAWNEIDDRRNTRTKLIKRSTFLKIYKPGPFELPNRSPERRRIYNYRSGMFIYRYKNKNVNSYAIHHGGNWLGFNSYLMRGHVYPFRRRRLYELTVVVLSNYLPGPGEGDVPYKIGKLISEVYWQLQGQDIYNVLRYI